MVISPLFQVDYIYNIDKLTILLDKLSQKLKKLNPFRQALRISAIYFVLSMLWILSTDIIHLLNSAETFSSFIFNSGKGLIYVIVSALILFFLMRRYFTSLHTAAGELSLSEKKFHTLSDNIDVAITRRDTEGRCLFVNNTTLLMADKIPGFLKNSSSASSASASALFIGKTPAETYTDPLIAEAFMNGIKETVAARKPVTRKLNYGELYFEAHFIPELDENEEVISVITMVTDRTDEKLQILKMQISEDALKDKTNYLNTVIEALPLAVFDLDKGGRVVSIWNEAAEKIFGWEAHEVIGKRLPIVPEEKLEEFDSIREIAFTEGRIFGKEVTRKKKSGEDVSIKVQTFPVARKDGKITRILSYNEDLTLRNQYEDEISQNSRYLKLLYEAGLFTTGTFDMHEIYKTISVLIAGIVDAGSIVISSLGEDASSLTCVWSVLEGKPIDVTFLPELNIDAKSAYFQSQAIKTGKSIIVNDYSRRIAELRGFTLFDDKGPIPQSRFEESEAKLPGSAVIIPLKYKNKISGAQQVFSYKEHLYTMKDLRMLEPVAVLIASAAERARLYEKAQDEIRERKLAYDEIRKLNKGIEQSPNSIVITDHEGNIEYVNPFFTEITGYSTEDVIGKNPRILSSGKTLPETYENMWRVITSGEVWQGEFLNRKKSGELFWESVSIGPITDEGKNTTHYIAIKQDITEKKKNNIRLKESLQEKETMLKEIHHRVKNNLQIISSLLNMQAEHYKNPEAKEAINTSRSRVKAMAIVHENLYRSPDLAKTPMDGYIRKLVKNIYSVYGVTEERIGLECRVDGISFGLDTIIPLGLIINEAISNSLKHAFPEGRSGKISISLTRFSEFGYTLRIKDNGIGISQQLKLETAGSLGMILITGLTSQLDGSSKLTNGNGTELLIEFKEVKYKSRV